MNQVTTYSSHQVSLAQRPSTHYGLKRIRLVFTCTLGLWSGVALCGCNEHGGKCALEGTVTLDGQPLREGGIEFFPLPGTRGPTAGGQIVKGRFYIEPDGGTMAGTFRVLITATRKTGKQISDPTAHMMGPNVKHALVDEYEQYIPAHYNKQSELTAEVIAGRQNYFQFALSSQR